MHCFFVDGLSVRLCMCLSIV